MLLPASVGTTAATAAGLSGLMTVTPNQMRAQTSALYYLIVNLFGLTVGPTGIAMFTDYVFADTNMLRYSVASVATIAGVVAAILLSYNPEALSPQLRGVAELEPWPEPKSPSSGGTG